ncbi:MAG: hypothetical protein ACT4QC_19185 [Planctomycetaceae bacterium]
MNKSFRTAFWAMCLGLTVAMMLFVGVELTGGRPAKGPKAAAARVDSQHASVTPGFSSATPRSEPRQAAQARPAARARGDGTLPGSVVHGGTGHAPARIDAGRTREIPATAPALTDGDGDGLLVDDVGTHVVLSPQLEPEVAAAEGRSGGALVPIRPTVARPQLDVVMDSAEGLPAGAAADPHLSRQLDRILAQLDRLALRQEQLSPAPTLPAPRLLSKIYRPKYLSVRAMQALAAPLLTEGVGRIGTSVPQEAAGSPGDDEPPAPSDAVVVRDTAEVLRKIDRLLVELDLPPPQVLIEATVLAVRLDARRPLGVNLAEFRGSSTLGFSLDPAGEASPAFTPNAAAEPGATAVRLSHGGATKCGVLRGDVQSFISSLRNELAVEGASAWQASVVNRHPAEFVIGDRSIAPANAKSANGGGAILQVRPMATRSGAIQLDVRWRIAAVEALAAAPTAWTNARSHQFIVNAGQTAIFSGFLSDSAAAVEALRLSGETAPAAADRVEVIVLLTPHLLSTATAEVQSPRTAQKSQSEPKKNASGSARPAPPPKRNARLPGTRTTSHPSGKGRHVPARLASHAVGVIAADDKSLGEIPELVLPELKPARPTPLIRPAPAKSAK